MATYRVTDPATGRVVKLTGDSPPTEEELNQVFSAVGATAQKPSLLKRGYDALAVPEQKSREGLQMLAQLSAPKTEVTGNLPRDIAMNIPRIGLETLSETAPGFISRGAMLTGGALKGLKEARPALSAVRKGVFSTLEKTSGIAPRQTGALDAAYKDPTLIFAKGKEAGSKFYEAAKATAKEVSEEATKLARPDRAPKVIAQAVEKANAGTLTPIEAFKARKAADALVDSKTYMKDDIIPLRRAFDTIAKTDPNIAKGDALVARGVKASALRHLLPTNIGGTFSSFRTGIGGAAAAMIPGGKVIAPIALSPLVQGAGATALGAASKAAPPLLTNTLKSGSALAGTAKAVDEPFKLKPDLAALQRGEKKEAKLSVPVEIIKEAMYADEPEKISKPLTEEKAYELKKKATSIYLAKEKKEVGSLTPADKARINKKARRMAKNEGYTWEGDF